MLKPVACTLSVGGLYDMLLYLNKKCRGEKETERWLAVEGKSGDWHEEADPIMGQSSKPHQWEASSHLFGQMEKH